MANRLYANGAYGRSARIEDWKAGKDFKFFDGPYFSIRDAEKLLADGWEEIEFRGAAGGFLINLSNPSEEI